MFDNLISLVEQFYLKIIGVPQHKRDIKLIERKLKNYERETVERRLKKHEHEMKHMTKVVNMMVDNHRKPIKNEEPLPEEKPINEKIIIQQKRKLQL